LTTVTCVATPAHGAIYKGLADSETNGQFLYATDFHNGTVDIFDASFTLFPCLELSQIRRFPPDLRHSVSRTSMARFT
jgi:hypothetical protein